MTTSVHLWQYLVELVLEWEFFETKFVDKIDTLFKLNHFFPETRAVCEMEKYSRVGQATDENIMWLFRFECLITKATNTQSE